MALSEQRQHIIIDGAHRLSALAAWVHDDYGDQHASIRFFDNNIPSEQQKAAEATRKLLRETIGSYHELKIALRNIDTTPKDKLRLARNLGVLAIHLQWVEGEADKAESSFFKINQKATPIDPTELDMIKSRHKPNALAARAFIRAGTGHKYWSNFDERHREEIEKIAKEVYDLIFKPSLETAIRTADLPVAGRGYSSDSLRMVFELVNFVNNLTPEMWREENLPRGAGSRTKGSTAQLPDDVDGTATIKFMRAARKAAGLIAGNEPASLALHPAAYFYSATGRFQPAAFLATVAFILELQERRALAKFTDIRSDFEDFLIKYKYFLNQIVRTYGSLQKAVPPILTMHRTIFDSLTNGLSEDETLDQLKDQSALTSLKVTTDEDRRHGRNFSAQTKNAKVLEEVITNAPRCGICGARLPLRSVSFDHKVRRADGGSGSPENSQLTHPYCNTGYKESTHAKSIG